MAVCKIVWDIVKSTILVDMWNESYHMVANHTWGPGESVYDLIILRKHWAPAVGDFGTSWNQLTGKHAFKISIALNESLFFALN